MRRRYALPALLMLALSCAACSTEAAQVHPSPTVVLPSQAATPASTVSAPTGTPRPDSQPTLPSVPRYFTEAFDAKPPRWVFLQVDNGQPFSGATVRDGFLVFDLPAVNQWGYALYGGQTYTDALVEAQVQSRTTGDGAAGLVCDYDEGKGWYEFNIFADQTYQLLFGQWLAPGIARYTPLYQGESQAIRNDANRIGLQCQGNLLAPSVNGAPLRQWSEQKFGLKSGKVGLSASSFGDAPFSIAFDWVKVSAP